MTIKDELILRIEEEIENMEGIKFSFNERLDDAIGRVKKIRFDLLFGNLTTKINNDLKKCPSCDIYPICEDKDKYGEEGCGDWERHSNL